MTITDTKLAEIAAAAEFAHQLRCRWNATANHHGERERAYLAFVEARRDCVTLQELVGLCHDLQAARAELAACQRRCGTLMGDLLKDSERRAIDRLIDKHGIIDADLWAELVQQRDTAEAELAAARKRIAELERKVNDVSY